MIEEQLSEERFALLSEKDRDFIIAFTHSLASLGYTYGDNIGSGFCWGRYMLIFRKAQGKSKNVAARIYIQEKAIVLRMFFNNVTKHAGYISSAPEQIQEVFTGSYGDCRHCRPDPCKFRKSYTIGGRQIEKCNGATFTFHNPVLESLPDYMGLFQEFYPPKSPCGGTD